MVTGAVVAVRDVTVWDTHVSLLGADALTCGAIPCNAKLLLFAPEVCDCCVSY